MLYFASEEFCGWLGQSRLERLSTNQFVGQMDRPSTSLDSIRSEMVKPLQLALLRGQAMGRACPSQTLLIKLLGGLL